ncbi:MAG: nucleotidyltransferase domain-containing protein, partial [Methanobacteriota archaeon]
MPEISEMELQKIREFLRKREQREQQRRRRLFRAASEDFHHIVEMIIRKYRPKRIYQWGSLLNEQHFGEHSDIDIALEGLNSIEDYFALLGDAEEMTSFPLDIVMLEKIHPLHAESIKK